VALNGRDRSKILRSIARWLAGLKPVFGKKHYFERYAIAMCVTRVLGGYRGSRRCPFCGKLFKRTSSLVTHIIRFHSVDIEELLEQCEEHLSSDEGV